MMGNRELILEQALKKGLELGFTKENLFLKLLAPIFTKAADIIHEGEKGSYDAAVLGRRGISILEAAFEESVSKSIFESAFAFPLWLCRSSDPNRKNILFYADGTQTSFTMADHIGFILAVENHHQVDIMPSTKVWENASAKEDYISVFSVHGIPENRINWRKPVKDNIAGEILTTVEQGFYSAVALGRSNPGTGILARLFRGPVCPALFKELQDAALWVCN